MTCRAYLCRFQLDQRCIEEVVSAENAFAAQCIVEARYAGARRFRWLKLPQLERDCYRM